MTETASIRDEREHRRAAWARLQAEGGPLGVVPSVLRKLGIYGGAQGIWVDKARTGPTTPDGTGVTVAVLHTGSSYADDLASDGVIYHYPKTARPPGRDQNEIDATKAARRLGLPVFVITYPSEHADTRNVHLGWVEDWDDQARVFLIAFGEEPPSVGVAPPMTGDAPFRLVSGRRGKKREVEVREGQPRFKFQVLKRYGPRCAVCDLDLPVLLDAAHLCPKNEGGTDDPRNGLVFCAVHHRALDAGLFAIDPATGSIQFRDTGPTAQALRITRETLGILNGLGS